jgi:hypothetical protein
MVQVSSGRAVCTLYSCYCMLSRSFYDIVSYCKVLQHRMRYDKVIISDDSGVLWKATVSSPERQ